LSNPVSLKESPVPVTIDVVGAGMCGLFMAFYLQEKGFQVRIFEHQPVGGMIQTHYQKNGLVETAANAFMANPELERMSEVIGVPLYEKKDVARKRYIFRNGKMRRWPLSFLESLSFLWGLFGFLCFRQSKKPRIGETLAHWGQRVFGKGTAQFLIGPGVQGIYGTDAEQLSARLIVGKYFGVGFSGATPFLKPSLESDKASESERKNIKRKPRKSKLRGSVAPAEGMGQWTKALKKHLLQKGCIFIDKYRQPQESSNSPVIVAPGFRGLGDWSNDWQALPGINLVTLTVFFDSSTHGLKPGYGCLFPKSEGFSSLGVLMNYNIFENRVNKALSETYIFGSLDSGPNATLEKDLKDQYLTRALEDRKKIMGQIAPSVKDCFVKFWDRAMPLYGTELESFLENRPRPSMEGETPLFFGNFLGEIGLSALVNRAQHMVNIIVEEKLWKES